MTGPARPAPARRDTIFALSTPPGRGAIAVVRLSGLRSGEVISALTKCALPSPRRATLATLRDPADGAILDRGMVSWFPGPASVTGEDVAELHLHGGRAVSSAVLGALAGLPGLRPAEPGEFTRRAFANGKLDLTEAEAIADLVDAETKAQRLQALRQLSGAFGHLVEGWRLRLLQALATAEAGLDFPEEGLPDDLASGVRHTIAAVGAEIAIHLADGRRGERLRDGLQIAIVGPVNAGKSSLLNALAQRDAAIVSDRPGTTRDVVEVALDLGGYPVVLADTAGLREALDPIEAEGIRRARQRADQADLRLYVVDATALDAASAAPVGASGKPAADARPDHETPAPDTIRVINKIDLRPDLQPPAEAVAISARTGAGLDTLLARLADEAEQRLTGDGSPAVTRARHRTALEDTRAALLRAPAAPLPELAAEDLRLACRALGRITGRVDVEDMLDLLFASFCIGK